MANYPFTPSSWTEPVSQNLYASLFFFLLQLLFTFLGKKGEAWRRKIFWIELPPNVLCSMLVSVIFTVFVLIRSDSINRWILLLLLLSMVFSFYSALQEIYASQVMRKKVTLFKNLGLVDSNSNPSVSDYKELLKRANHEFLFMGIGSEKLTRDIDIFNGVMNRCSSDQRPARFILISPQSPWLEMAAKRRGLSDQEFKLKIVKSLQKIRRIHSDKSIPIEVRFYDFDPVIRLIFINEDECWFSYYSKYVGNPEENNEFEHNSNSNLIFKKISGLDSKSSDFYGAFRAYFEQQWKLCQNNTWNFQDYI
jgi:hypothetical protein